MRGWNPTPKSQHSVDRFIGMGKASATFGAYFAEVAVNAVTGETRVRRMHGAFAAGRILNEKTARSQCLGGMTFGIGMALTEELIPDPRDGHLDIRDFAECYLPVNADVPQIDVVLLAWLMMGDRSKRRYSDERDHNRPDHDSRYNRRSEGNGFQSSHPASGQNGQDAGAHRSNLTYTRGDGHSYNTPSWAKSSTEHNADVVKSARDTAAHLGSTLSGAATSAAETARDVGDTVGDKASDLTQTASDASKSAVDGAKDLATAASERMEALQKQLSEGTEHMSAEARKRIVAARETALKARDATMATAKQGHERATDMFEEQPLVAGALAVALGAAIAAALPRSRVEDDYLGKQSDHLIEEAERIFAEEKAKLSMAAQAATTEAKKVLDEASDEIGSLVRTAVQK